MMRKLIGAAIALLMLSVASAKPVEIRDDAVLGYLDHARKAVRVTVTLGSASAKWDIDDRDGVAKLRPLFDTAVAAAGERAPLVSALRSHWIKISQCLTLGVNQASHTGAELARCQSELAERAALVELEYR